MEDLAKVETTMPALLLTKAVENNLGLEQLERLMQLQERWEANQARKQYYDALSEFQSICPEITKSKVVAFNTTNYKYAPLAEIDRVIKEPMAKVGLSKRWEINDEGNKITVTCIITHSSGHSEKTTMSGAPDDSGKKNNIQQRGSTITYLQRYTLIGALGLSTADEDNDGHTYGNNDRQANKPQNAKPESTPSEKELLRKQYLEILDTPEVFNEEEKKKFAPKNWTIDAFKEAVDKLSIMRDERLSMLYAQHEEAEYGTNQE